MKSIPKINISLTITFFLPIFRHLRSVKLCDFEILRSEFIQNFFKCSPISLNKYQAILHLRFTLFKFIFQSFYSFCIGISAFFPGSLRLHFYSCNVKHVMDILQTSLFLLLSCGFIPVNLFPFSFRLILDFGLFFGRIFTCEIYG